MFKVGQRVWDIRLGWGTVTSVSRAESKRYPMEVQFEGAKDVYTLEGGSTHMNRRSLFFEEILIPESALKPKRWRAERSILYCFVASYGDIVWTAEWGHEADGLKYKLGNYFQTEAEARESKFYRVFHESEL